MAPTVLALSGCLIQLAIVLFLLPKELPERPDDWSMLCRPYLRLDYTRQKITLRPNNTVDWC